MWLTSSSIGRKLVMAVTGACLVLFVTFHCLMNAVAIACPAAYNVICEFLGANWYALAASAGLALLFVIHIFYAVWLTLQNRKARGADRYAVSVKPATVEWSSQNMLVLGIVILAFLVVHMVQFWAKMQLVEMTGAESTLPPAIGTLFIQEAFSHIYTPIIYIIGFAALWFHMNHGFWSMFQSAGWTNNTWLPRLRKISCWYTTIVIALFVAQAVVFTVNANNDYYRTNAELREQYKETVAETIGVPAGQLDFDAMPSKAELTDLQTQIRALLADPVQMQSAGYTPQSLNYQLAMSEKWLKVLPFVEYLKTAEKDAVPAVQPEAENVEP
ncbi:succinate dehydrogenase cytochrome b subunit [Muribaculum caecicola]|jgi:succinate dehydrogenase / fumarate reductase cytochrome b subunit|uniref:Succinate dehydrogenase cytochrome b subunit n=1 Tax=Muribaculum caecicola TaxID=3038144 RepID=A0AC61S6X5_9BACT|nr:succinate dehydrogenase cytochrome b subunit [Muribaculum caecicola]THG54395.1 succinate dehydrogenase cytochrome b subunit [Muribaculum caecicola]